MANDNEPNKPVHLIYLCGGLLAFYLLNWTSEWIWGFFTKTPSELITTLGAATVALLGAVYLYKNERSYGLVTEVAGELDKVVWPNFKDTRTATIVVIVMTIISALLLGVFDYIWAQGTMLIYGR